jgi:serine/threonine protein kinase
MGSALTASPTCSVGSPVSGFAAPQETKRSIEPLLPSEKIYDFYYWEKVLQEDGDGGKVVVCRAKTPEEKSAKEGGRPLTRTCFGEERRAPSVEDVASQVEETPKATPTPKGKSRKDFNYVMKIRSKALFRQPQQEARYRGTLLRMLNLPPHEGVMRVHEVLEDEDFYYVVTEKAKGGDFFETLLHEYRDGIMPTDAVRSLLAQILEAVGHVHRQGMLHRDIKPDNLVMQVTPDPASLSGTRKHVMLIDFDHADPEWTTGSSAIQVNQLFGTLRFNAPETFLGRYSQESDLYSIGAILYLLMSGGMPYSDELFGEDLSASPTKEGCNALFRRLSRIPVSWEAGAWSAQPACRDLCQRLLAFEPQDRFHSAEEALAHAFFVPNTEN